MKTLTIPHMGKKLRKLLAERNMTLEELGQLIDMTKQGVGRLTTVASFQSRTTYKISKAMQVPVDYFFDE